MEEKNSDTTDPQTYNDSYDEVGDSDFTSHTPQSMDKDTFEKRNDPQALLYRFRLQLLNAYEIVKESEDSSTGKITRKRVIVRKKDGKGKVLPPRVNKQGVEDIISYVEKFLNGHTVQGNIDTMSEYRNNMCFIGNDVVCHFIAKRRDWNVSLSDCDILISNAINIIGLFLTRTLFNEERKGYGESYKETTHRDIKPEVKNNVFQKAGGWLKSKGWG